MGQSLPKAVTSIVLEEDVMASEITLARAAEVQIYKDHETPKGRSQVKHSKT